jgi:hypothetical protein
MARARKPNKNSRPDQTQLERAKSARNSCRVIGTFCLQISPGQKQKRRGVIRAATDTNGLKKA